MYRRANLLRVRIFYNRKMKYLHIIYERCKRETQERTVVVLVFYYQPIGM